MALNKEVSQVLSLRKCSDKQPGICDFNAVIKFGKNYPNTAKLELKSMKVVETGWNFVHCGSFSNSTHSQDASSRHTTTLKKETLPLTMTIVFRFKNNLKL